MKELNLIKKEKNKIAISIAIMLIGAYLLGCFVIYLLSLYVFIKNLSLIGMLAFCVLPGVLYTTMVSLVIRSAMRDKWSLHWWFFGETKQRS